MNKRLSVGFIGFGEAGFHIAKGLKAEGVNHMFLCHLRKNDTQRAALVKNRAQEAGVEYLRSAEEVIEKSGIIISVVTPAAAVTVAKELGAYLKPGKIYVDLTSSLPDNMKIISSIVTSYGAEFVDGAIMGAVPIKGYKVLIYISGPKAEDVMQSLNSVGMNLKNVGDEPGQASSIKLMLSIFTKGLGALLVEMLLASHHLGIEEHVIAALEQFYTKGIPSSINRSLGSSAIHAGRRVVEMESSAKLIESVGVDSSMTMATINKLKWIESLDLIEHFKGVVPENYKEVIKAWEEIGVFTRLEK